MLAGSAVASADDVSLDLSVEAAELRVGDRVPVRVSAGGGSGWLWGDPEVAVEPGGSWELVDGPNAVAGSRPPAWQLVLAPMALGELQLPAVTVVVRPPGAEPQTVRAETPVTVNVGSVVAGDDSDPVPAPMRDPIGVSGFPWEWILPIVGMALPLVAGVAWWFRGRTGTAAGGRVVLAPLAELETLAAELDGRIGREPADGICDRVAAGLRRYLERRTGDPAGEMTSFELRLLARRRGWPEPVQHLVQRVMGVADGVRFGRRPSSRDELRTALSGAVEAARGVEAFLEPPEQMSGAGQGGDR
jgi:hypothetical protein